MPSAAISILLRELSARYPKVELTLLNGTATEVMGHVDLERADLAFHFDRGPLRNCFEERHIGSVKQGIFVAAGHVLLEHGQIKRRDLARHRQLLLHADDVETLTYSPMVWRADSFYRIAEMVADDLGWAILPVNIANAECYPKPLQALDCPSLALPLLSVRMVWCQGRQLRETEKWVASRLTELLCAN